MPMVRGFIVAALIACGPAIAIGDPVPIPAVSLVIKDDPIEPIVPKTRFFKLRSGTRIDSVMRIAPPAPGGSGDPTIGGAVLTVANIGGGSARTTYVLPAARWSLIGTPATFKGYQFHDDTPVDGPIVRVFVKPDKLFVAGGKASWTYLLGPTPQGAVAARLALGSDEGWCVETPASNPPSLNDTPARFVGAKGSIPTTCTPLP